MTESTAALAWPSADLRSRLQSATLWNLVAAAFSQGSTFAVNIAVANLLGREVFGQYAMILSTLLTISAIAQVATGYTATKYVAEFRSIDKQRTGRILGLCALVAVTTASAAALALLAGAPWLAVHALKAPHLAVAPMITSGVVFFTVMNGFKIGALAGLESYPALGKAGIIGGCSYVAACSVMAWVGGLTGTLTGMVMGVLAQWVILSRFLRHESGRQGIMVSCHGSWNERSILLKFALPAALSGLSTMPAMWLANAFLVRQPDGYSQLALYTAANNLRVFVLFLPAVLNNAAMSLLNNQVGLGNKKRFRELFWTNMAVTVAAVLLGTGIIALMGKLLLQLFGRDFGEGFSVLVILMFSTIPEGIALASYQIIQAHGAMWLSLLAVAVPRDALIAFLAYLLVPSYGAVGLASAYAIAWGLAFLVTSIVVWLIGLMPRPPE